MGVNTPSILWNLTMTWQLRVGISLAITMGLVSWGQGQDFKPAPSKKPDEKTLKAIAEKTFRLGERLKVFRKQGLRDPWLADVEIYHRAAQWIVQHDEFFRDTYGAWTVEALDRGLLRAQFMAAGEFPWAYAVGFPVIRAYRSRIDGSVQPYAVTFPPGYGKDPLKKWRLDVFLHGRDKNLNEVKFLQQYNGDQAAAANQNHVQLAIYGRGNNAYRWAGEADVFDALNNFVTVEQFLKRDQLLDLDRIVLRGFSMGGAGTWHLGLHWPDRWCVIGPGAGFTTTHGYAPNLPAKLPDYQEACLRIYDAVDYAENAFNVPVVAYSGAKDPQRQAAVNIETRLKKLGIPLARFHHLVAKDLEHKFPPEWQKKADALYAKYVTEGREENPAKIKFVTYTLRYPKCHWIELLGLERHYERAAVAAEKTETGYTIKTSNIRGLLLHLPVGPPAEVELKIDEQTLKPRPWLSQGGTYQIYLMRRQGRWTALLPQRYFIERARTPQKVTGLQGPIDDAFTHSFLCVRGTGKAWHDATAQFAEANLSRFEAEWAKFWRGRLPVKDDSDVTNDDIDTKNLILFGDPASNSLIAQVLDGLPLIWTKDAITLADKKYAAADHVPVLIYPSPVNANRYVVLNSGHTFRAADYQGTNALLYPRLGDFAVLRLAATEGDPLAVEVATAGLFDEFWKIGRK